MPPKLWSTVVGGGYWTKELPELELVKQKNKKYKKDLKTMTCLKCMMLLILCRLHHLRLIIYFKCYARSVGQRVSCWWYAA
jgi:hypothetical protein